MPTVIKRSESGQNLGHDLTGARFGKLTIIEPTGERCPHGYKLWQAKCDCGTEIVRPSYRFTRGLKSCGCGPKGRPRLPNQGSHVNHVYKHVQRSAQERGIPFNLTIQEARVLFESPCSYCGVIRSRRRTHKNLSGEYLCNGIDRIDSSRGYEPGNVTSCCPTCNMAKGEMTVEEFRAWLARAYRHMHRAA